MSIVAALERFAADTGVHAFMNTAWAWPLAESLHFIGLTLLLGSVGIVDARLLGFAKRIELQSLHGITRWGIAGFLINAMTGIAFFVSDPGQYLYNPAFQLKTLCILVAGANVLAFYLVAWPRVHARGGVSTPAKLGAAISLCAWTGVIVFGRLITFYRPPEHWCFWCG